MRDRFLLEALDDLRVLAEWYEQQQLGLGDRLTDRVEEFVQARLNAPRLCSRVGRPPRGAKFESGWYDDSRSWCITKSRRRRWSSCP